MKIIQNEKIFGLNLWEQYIATVIFLILNAVFCAIVWITARTTYDTPSAMVGFGFMILSSIALIAVILKKHDISLVFSLLGTIFSGLFILVILSVFLFEPSMISFDPIFLADLIPAVLFPVASILLWNQDKQLRLQKYPHLRYRRKKSSKHGIASIIIGIISIEAAFFPPVGIALGVTAILLGLKAKRRRDKMGLAGIVLGTISITIGAIFLIMIFIIGRYIY